MLIIVLGILILRIKISVSFHIENHMDFQKVGEVIFNNEKYNILKPTTHVITDYFKDFMLRRDNINFPTKRVFIDHNGFRHAWTGFGEKIKSLRKTEHVKKSINENNNLTEAKTESKMEEIKSTEANTESNIEEIKNTEVGTGNKKQENNSTDGEKYTDDDTTNETRNEKKSKHISASEEENSNNRIVSKIKLRDGDKTTSAPAKTATAQTAAPAQKKDGSGRTIAQTTFFCPFFGVITMSAFID